MSPFEVVLTNREKRELRGEVYRNCDLVGLDLSRADLRGARFEQVRLSSCNLSGADLRGAQFVLCTFESVVLKGALLGDNRFYGTKLVEAIGLSDEARAWIERDGGLFPNAPASEPELPFTD